MAIHSSVVMSQFALGMLSTAMSRRLSSSALGSVAGSLSIWLLISGLSSQAVFGASAPGAPGATFRWAPAAKSMLGTSATQRSRVYFTGHRGIVTEVFYPTVDTPTTVELQFLIGDKAHTFIDAEKQTPYNVSRPDSKAMLFDATTSNESHRWRLTKRIFTDPARNALIQRVTFYALAGKRVSDFNVYVLHKPAMDSSRGPNSSRTLTSRSRTMLVASQGRRASALAVSLPWMIKKRQAMVSSGFLGTSDGWTDLMGASADKTMHWIYDSAQNGTLTQMGLIDFRGSNSSSISFDVVLGYGESEANAMAAANGSLSSNLDEIESAYQSEWNEYANGLSTQAGLADDQYYLAAMTLKASADKSNGAIVAGLGTPWGETNGDNNPGGYHLVWARDLFKFSNALITAGDRSTANNAVDYLFNVQMQTSDCGVAEYKASGCPQGFSRVGRFPQNSWVSGKQYWQGTQMDQVAMPIILADRLDRQDLWPKIRLAADYLASNGPYTYQDRWEEQSGYSPSTIAAEVAGLVSAAKFARVAGDLTRAKTYLRKADQWQQNVARWTFTTTGPYAKGRYFIRITKNQDPNDDGVIDDRNGGGVRSERAVIDGGFLELVRMGLKEANDPDILDTIAVYDAYLKQDIPGKGSAWFRYNFDGYGEKNNGDNYDATGFGYTRGRLWPILTAERGIYEIAKAGHIGLAGMSYLKSLRAFSSPEGMVPEQVWNLSASLPGGWWTALPPGMRPGTATKSIAPLSWAMGEYINLTASIAANRIVDLPAATCQRYATCPLLPPVTHAQIALSVFAQVPPDDVVYITGSAVELGQWDPDLAIPLSQRTFPVWTQRLNLQASTTVAYKFFRRSPDGTIVWESLPKHAIRTLTVPDHGMTLAVKDSVHW